MTTFNDFKASHEIKTFIQLVNFLGTDTDSVYEPSADVRQAHVYLNGYYILELWNGKFWTIVDRTDWTRDTLEAMETEFYDALVDAILDDTFQPRERSA